MWYLFLDESGDLGFDPRKQSSKFLTIGVLAVSDAESVKAIRCAVRNTLRRKVNKPGAKRRRNELKGESTSIGVKRYFYNQICNRDFGVYSSTIEKSRVLSSSTNHPDAKARLYNYIAHQVLKDIRFECVADGVELIVDKSKGKREIAEFDANLLSQLQGRLDPNIALTIRHLDSHEDGGLSAADLFVWGIGRYYERGDEEWLTIYKEKVRSNLKYP